MRLLRVKGTPRDWAELTNNRIQLLATPSALACYWIADGGAWSWLDAFYLAVGMMTVGSATAALNQLLEVDIDKRMPHTCNRPLPTGRIRKRDAFVWGAGGAVFGILWLLLFLGPLTAWLAAAMLVIYDYIYTPLKRITPVNIFIGAVPAAFPPLIGYAAAGVGLDMMAGILFLIVLLWQLPHFLSRAWYHRLDYQIGGLHWLPGADPTGREAGKRSVHYALALIPASQIPMLVEQVGLFYFFGACTMSLAFMVAVIFIGMYRKDTKGVVMAWASTIYVPLLIAVLIVDLLV